MSQQANFYLVESDIQHISNYLREEGFVFLSPNQSESYAEVVDSLNSINAVLPLTKKWVILKEDLSSLRNGRNVHRLEYLPSHLFISDTGKNALGRGRFYLEDIPQTHDIENAEVFQDAVVRFFRWFKRQYPVKKDAIFYGMHTSQAVIKRVQANEFFISLNNSEKDLEKIVDLSKLL